MSTAASGAEFPTQFKHVFASLKGLPLCGMHTPNQWGEHIPSALY